MFGDMVDAFRSRESGFLLLLCLWTLWATRGVVHRSTGAYLHRSQVDGLEPVGAIMDAVDAVFVGGAKGDRFATQRPDLGGTALAAAKSALDPAGIMNPGVLTDVR